MKGDAVGACACLENVGVGGCSGWMEGGGLFRRGGGALREANIFSGLRQHSENRLPMLMCIRSESGKY